MEDGVEVIVNHLESYNIEGEPNALHLEEEFVIGLERDDLAEIGITDIGGFDVDSEGNIFFGALEVLRILSLNSMRMVISQLHMGEKVKAQVNFLYLFI